MSIYINKQKFDALSPHYKSIIEMAAAETNMWMMAAYDTRNAEVYRRLVSTGQYIDSFPDLSFPRKRESMFYMGKWIPATACPRML